MSGSQKAPAIPETSPEPTAPPAVPAGGEERVRAKEIGGRSGPDPTRYGDWEKDGRCIDF